MKLSHYLTGRSQKKGYDFYLLSEDYAQKPFFIGEWMRSTSRHAQAESEDGAIELINQANEGGITVASHSVFLPQHGFGYTLYSVMPWQRAGKLAPTALIKVFIQTIALGETFFLSPQAYKQLVQGADEGTLSSLAMRSIDELAVYTAYAQLCAREQAKCADYLAAHPEIMGEEKKHYQPAALCEKNLWALLGRIWQTCWQKHNGHAVRPILILATSPEKNNPDIQALYAPENVRVQGAIFFGEQVLPFLHEEMMPLLSVSFASLAESPSPQHENVCMLCYPTQRAYNAQTVYCPFEDTIYDSGLTPSILSLGRRMVEGMPAAWQRVQQHPNGKVAGANFDLALLLSNFEDQCATFSPMIDVSFAEEGLIALSKAEEHLVKAGMEKKEERLSCLFPLEKSFIQALQRQEDDFSQDIWNGLAVRMKEMEGFVGVEAEERLGAYEALFVKHPGPVIGGALLALARFAPRRAALEAERVLCRAQDVDQPLDKGCLTTYLARFKTLLLDKEEGAAVDYEQLILIWLRRDLVKDVIKPLIKITDAQRQALLTSSITPYQLSEDLFEHHEQALFMQSLTRDSATFKQLKELMDFRAQLEDRQQKAVVENTVAPFLLHFLMIDQPLTMEEVYTQAGIRQGEGTEGFEKAILLQAVRYIENVNLSGKTPSCAAFASVEETMKVIGKALWELQTPVWQRCLSAMQKSGEAGRFPEEEEIKQILELMEAYGIEESLSVPVAQWLAFAMKHSALITPEESVKIKVVMHLAGVSQVALQGVLAAYVTSFLNRDILSPDLLERALSFCEDWQITELDIQTSLFSMIEQVLPSDIQTVLMDKAVRVFALTGREVTVVQYPAWRGYFETMLLKVVCACLSEAQTPQAAIAVKDTQEAQTLDSICVQSNMMRIPTLEKAFDAAFEQTNGSWLRNTEALFSLIESFSSLSFQGLVAQTAQARFVAFCARHGDEILATLLKEERLSDEDKVRHICIFVQKGMLIPSNMLEKGLDPMLRLCAMYDRCLDDEWQTVVQVSVHQGFLLPEGGLASVARAYGLKVLAQKEHIRRTLPLLVFYTQTTPSGLKVNWAEYFDEAFACPDRPSLEKIDLLKEPTGAYFDLQALMLALAPISQYHVSLKAWIQGSSFFVKAQKNIKKQFANLCKLPQDGRNTSLLAMLLGKCF